MNSKIKSLYLSYDGMTDPLGQSQVLPYLHGLSTHNITFTLISFEKEENYSYSKDLIQSLCDKSGITWIPLMYTKKPPILSTIYDIARLVRYASRLVKKENFDVVHCRSYLTSLVGIHLKRKFGTKFIFDMRGFWADERVDGKLWNLNNPIYKKVYTFFKKKERKFLRNADYTVSLTEAGKEEIMTWNDADKFGPIKIIPCCADLEHFSIDNVDMVLLNSLKNDYNIKNDDIVLSYLGSIGTWYLLDEMLMFFKVLNEKHPTAKFLFITKDNATNILNKAESLGIKPHSIIIRPASRQEVPTLLALSSINIFFIKPAYSKKASSPTKQGEVMSMGVPIICNDNVGDTAQIIYASEVGYVFKDFTHESFESSLSEIKILFDLPKEKISTQSKKYFDLSLGIKNYLDIYERLFS